MFRIFALFLMLTSLILYAEAPGSVQPIPPPQNSPSAPEAEEEDDETGEVGEDIIIEDEENTNEDEGVSS